VVNTWNNLPNLAVSANTTGTFKASYTSAHVVARGIMFYCWSVFGRLYYRSSL